MSQSNLQCDCSSPRSGKFVGPYYTIVWGMCLKQPSRRRPKYCLIACRIEVQVKAETAPRTIRTCVDRREASKFDLLTVGLHYTPGSVSKEAVQLSAQESAAVVCLLGPVELTTIWTWARQKQGRGKARAPETNIVVWCPWWRARMRYQSHQVASDLEWEPINAHSMAPQPLSGTHLDIRNWHVGFRVR